ARRSPASGAVPRPTPSGLVPMPGVSSRRAPAPISSPRCEAMRLLVTRPEPDGERTAERLRARGHDVVVAPLLRVDAVDFEFTEETVSAVGLTSANAARAVARHRARDALTALPAFAVGGHTAEAARVAGFADIRSADGARDHLIRLIAASAGSVGGPLLYLAGEDRAGELDLA